MTRASFTSIRQSHCLRSPAFLTSSGYSLAGKNRTGLVKNRRKSERGSIARERARRIKESERAVAGGELYV
jgi:hypothetical protein